MNRLTSFMRRIMYRLKRDYGSPLDIYYESADSVDLTTGKRNVTKQRWHLRRAVNLPTSIYRDSVFSAALKSQFQYGQSVELGDKTVLIDRKDLPCGVELGTENWYMIIANRRYEVKRVEEYDPGLAYFVVLKELKGAPLDRFVEVTVCDYICVEPNLNSNYPMNRLITVHDHIHVAGVINES